MTHRRRFVMTLLALPAALTLALSYGAVVAADDPPPDQPPAASPNDAETRPVQQEPMELLRRPGRALDERIDAEKLTEFDLSPLPEQVILPKPPLHRIATDPAEVPISDSHWEQSHQALKQGVDYLLAQQDEATGGWMTDVRIGPTDQPDKPSPVAVAVTALAVKGIVQAQPAWMQTPEFDKAMQFIRAAQQNDGSFEGGALTNYVTAAVVSSLASVDSPDVYDPLQDGVAWLKSNQWDQSEGLRAEQDWFGGAGYGGHGRPDLSNTQMMMDALYDAGVSPDEPAMQKALAFVSRTQNLKATNDAPWAGDDGGFIYTPANGGESMGSQAAGEGRYGELLPPGQARSLRSYGSMTYAGFKSMLYAGLSPDDIRVRAAFDWVRRHWTFEENPGLGQQGLYYYYHTLARALNVAQQNTITDVGGEAHNWREEMIDALIERQNDDGSWANSADRWLEGHPVLTTAYSVLALDEILKPTLELTGERAPAPEAN